ncbi:MAG: SdrD B-like domain-containing protein, partial [Halobacteriaceae archaeon]
MTKRTHDNESVFSRRTMLKGAVVAVASGAGFSGVAAAKGGNGKNGGRNGGETGYAGAGPYDPAAEGECSNCYRSQVFTLWAGQDNDAGTVTISNDDDNIYVTYDTNESADLKEVHVDVYSTADAVPDKRPAPGQAQYKADELYADAHTVTVPFADLGESVACGDDYYVIAHAALTSDEGSDDQKDADSDLSNEGETAYAGGSESALGDGKGAWFYVAEYTIECCCFDISGSVYEDGDGNATFDDGESGWGGIEVTLEDDAGNVVGTTTTDGDGSYTFEDIPGGEAYTVVVEAPDDYVRTENSGGYEISDLDGDLTGVDFGFTQGCVDLLTKYEWDEDASEFVWEKGRSSLGIDGDQFNITVTDTNDDGEPLGFEFDSIDNANGDGIYEATQLQVKAGTDTVIKQYDWASTGTYHVDGEPAISNFTLCINDAMWQLDFGTDDAPNLNTEDPATREGYGGGRELIRAAVYGPPNRTGNFSYSQSVSGVEVLDTEFDLEDGSGSDVPIGSGDAVTAKLTFEVTADEPLKLHA